MKKSDFAYDILLWNRDLKLLLCISILVIPEEFCSKSIFNINHFSFLENVWNYHNRKRLESNQCFWLCNKLLYVSNKKIKDYVYNTWFMFRTLPGNMSDLQWNEIEQIRWKSYTLCNILISCYHFLLLVKNELTLISDLWWIFLNR